MKRRTFIQIATLAPWCANAMDLRPQLKPHLTQIDAIYLDEPKRVVAQALLGRLMRVQRVVGYGNFNLISFDAARSIAKGYDSVGAFSAQEDALFEELFTFDARRYGFFGAKVIEPGLCNRKKPMIDYV